VKYIQVKGSRRLLHLFGEDPYETLCAQKIAWYCNLLSSTIILLFKNCFQINLTLDQTGQKIENISKVVFKETTTNGRIDLRVLLVLSN
jgi:hypothetical protein